MSEAIEQPVDETPVEEAVIEAAEPEQVLVDDEPLDPELAKDVISVPDSSAQDGSVKLVPLAALTGTRAQLKELKAQLATATEGSAKAQQLEQRIDHLSQQIAQLGPKAQAYDAAVAAQQQAPRREEPQDDTEAIDFATALDLYTPEGKPDIAKARKILGVVDHRAGQAAQQHVGPLARHTVQQQANAMLARAKNTAAPNGQKPDPATLEAIWSRLDPALTATPDGAKQAWAIALGYSAAVAPAGGQQPSQATRGTDGKFVAQTVPPPLHTERAGGKDNPNAMPLDDREKKYLKDAGISEKEYLESVKSAPWMRGR